MASQTRDSAPHQAAKNIKQITRAMQFVAASKLRRAQDATLAARPYSEKIDEVPRGSRRRARARGHPLLTQRAEASGSSCS
jgi:F-type H+-transporting ATPase subunit gamma